MSSKNIHQYIFFLKNYAFKKKLIFLYFLTITIIIFTAGASLVRPKLQGKVIDDLGSLKSTNLHTFMVVLGIYLGILLLNYLMNYAQCYIVSIISEEIASDIRQRLEDKLSTVKVHFFDKIRLSDLLLKVDKDVTAVKQCGITSIITLISNIVILLVVPPYMFSIHKGIAISNILLLVCVPYIGKILGKLIQDTSAKVLNGYNNTTNSITNAYNNWFVIRLFQCGQYVHDKYFENNQNYKKATNKQNFLYILNKSVILVIQFLGTIIIWVVGAQEVFKGNMTIGTIMALMNYQTIIMNPIIGIAQFSNEYNTAVVSLKDINRLLEYPDEMTNDGKEIKNIERIDLKSISFAYPQTKTKIFDNIHLSFERGFIYGLHGKSGQGKSTLFKIIAGIYQPLEGEVEVDGIELGKINICSYWKNTGYVMQRTHFFNDSIRQNIELLKVVKEEELDNISKCLDLYDEVHSLENIWDTEIQVDTSNFSEGQMRRIDIMRNILKNPKLLIFDEVTANIDGKRREHFYQLLHELSANKIIIFATHNTEELKEADIVIDLEKLRIG